VNILLGLSRGIDGLNARIGRAVYWLVLAAVVVSAANASVRYIFSNSSNAWLEIQWYLFSAVFLLCAGYTLLRNEHIRIDVVTGRFSPRVHAWIDIFGTLAFLLPMSMIIMWLSWPMVQDSYLRNEMSGDAGGLLRWPVKALMPIGFFLLSIQGASELIKRIAFLKGRIPNPAEKVQDNYAAPSESAR
jgi:TRAP-type mannitol/chloroaromatic compound transport system permease small subunit